MHAKNFSDNFATNKKIMLKYKKNLLIPGIVSKISLKTKSKSEKNSPAAIRNFKLKDSSWSKKQTFRDLSPIYRAAKSEKGSPKGIKIIGKINQLKRKNLSNVYLNLSKGSSKFSFGPHKKSGHFALERSKSSAKTLKPGLLKEKKGLIKDIKNHFKQAFFEFNTNLKFYKFIKLLGQGAFGKVILAEQVLTGIKVALKAIDKSYIQTESARKKIFREILILKKIKSPHVVKIWESFESSENIFIVMEFLQGGDLLDYLKKYGKMNESLAKNYFYQILCGAHSIHKNRVLHRDFKLDNILLDKNRKNIKICDFGVSKMISKGEIVFEQCGTPAYLAPEIVLDKGYEGFWSDVWSLGVLLYCMVCGTVPFKGNNLTDLHKAILLGKFELPDFLNGEVKDLITKMLQSIPKNRISIKNALLHPWFKQCTKCVHLTKNPYEIDQRAIKKIEDFGYPKDYILSTIASNSLNHVFALYNLLINCE